MEMDVNAIPSLYYRLKLLVRETWKKRKEKGKCVWRQIWKGEWAHAFDIVKKALVLDLYDIVFDEDCTVM